MTEGPVGGKVDRNQRDETDKEAQDPKVRRRRGEEGTEGGQWEDFHRTALSRKARTKGAVTQVCPAFIRPNCTALSKRGCLSVL